MSNKEIYEWRRQKVLETLPLYRTHGMIAREIAAIVEISQKQATDLLYGMRKKGLIAALDKKRNDSIVYVALEYAPDAVTSEPVEATREEEPTGMIDSVLVDYQTVSNNSGQAIPVLSENGYYEVFWPEGKEVVSISQENMAKIVQLINVNAAHLKTIEACCAMLQAEKARLSSLKKCPKCDAELA